MSASESVSVGAWQLECRKGVLDAKKWEFGWLLNQTVCMYM